jgi:hypothetical protein
MNASELIKAINAAADTPPADLTEVDRSQLLAACSKLRTALEDPIEFTTRIPMAVFQINIIGTELIGTKTLFLGLRVVGRDDRDKYGTDGRCCQSAEWRIHG